MGFYARQILPKLVNVACGTKPTRRQREKVVPLATGRVLEIGIGSGLNLPFYDGSSVSRVWGLDPSVEMWSSRKTNLERFDFDVEFVEGSAEEIPLDDGCADTVLATYTFCTIPDVIRSLVDVGRVLRPGGKLIFCEHGEAPDSSVARWQRRIDPLWSRFSGGCHLNRPIPSLLDQGGFEIRTLETMYLPGWRPASYNYWGTATPR
jgi:ubiquinone/menaquinone biosynthesis C-methylase UbiE